MNALSSTTFDKNNCWFCSLKIIKNQQQIDFSWKSKSRYHCWFQIIFKLFQIGISNNFVWNMKPAVYVSFYWSVLQVFFGRSTWHCVCLHSVRGICAVMLIINEWVLFLYDILALYRASVQCCRRLFSVCVQISSVFFHSCSFLLHNSLLSISVQPAYTKKNLK